MTRSLLPHILIQMLSPGRLTTIAQISKRALFPLPSGYPTPPPPEPSAAEKVAVRSSLLSALVAHTHKGIFQRQLATLMLGKQEGGNMMATLEGALEAVEDGVCNLHLVVFLLDRVVLGLFPELGVDGGMDENRTSSPPESPSAGLYRL
jgi:hypothetical protein